MWSDLRSGAARQWQVAGVPTDASNGVVDVLFVRCVGVFSRGNKAAQKDVAVLVNLEQLLISFQRRDLELLALGNVEACCIAWASLWQGRLTLSAKKF